MCLIKNILAVSFERVSGAYWAHSESERMEISRSEFLVMQKGIAERGSYQINRPAFDNRALAAILADVYAA